MACAGRDVVQQHTGGAHTGILRRPADGTMRVQLDGRVHALEVEGGGLGEDLPHLQVWWHRGVQSVHHRIPEAAAAAADMTQRQCRAREDVLRAVYDANCITQGRKDRPPEEGGASGFPSP